MLKLKAVISLALFAFVIFSATTTSVAVAADNGHAPLVHVGNNPATCGTVAGTNSGVVNVHSNVKQDKGQVNVSVHGALPNKTYVVDIRCVGAIGSLTTNGQGTGTAHIVMPHALTGTFFIDISIPPPGGAGSGGYGDTFIAGPFTLS